MTKKSARIASNRAGGGLPAISLDAASSTPLYEQLYVALRAYVLGGQLAPRTRIASTRALALELGVSRFTVVSAMDRLLAEGYLVARHGAGTFVVDTLPEQMMRVARDSALHHSAMRDSASPTPAPNAKESAAARVQLLSAVTPDITPTLSARGRALSAVVITGPRSEHNEPRPFRPRRPPLDLFPVALWARLVRRQWATAAHRHLDYGEPAGYRPLREAIAQHIAVTRGVRCRAEQVIVTSGSQQAFDILFRLLLDPGDRAWIEEPGYLDVRAALIGAGAELVPVPVDEYGINVAIGIERADSARLAVVSPSHQYPTGVTLAASRRVALLEWARRNGAWIIEDDYDSYYRYRGRPTTALQRLDNDTAGPTMASRVLYVGTFSKTMFPSLRLGFCIVPESLIDAVANARAAADRNSPIADQAALAEFIDDGHYDRHLRRVRLISQERYEAMRFHFERVLSGVVTLGTSSAGAHVLGWMDEDAAPGSSRQSLVPAVAKAAADDDLVVFQLSRYCLLTPPRDALVLGYGGLSPQRIASGAEQLARCIERVRVGRSA